MYSEIFSKAEYSDGKGKTTSVNTFIHEIDIISNPIENSDCDNWFLKLSGTQLVESGTGELGGETRHVNRDLTIKFSTEDIRKIVSVLAEKGKLRISI